MLLSVLDTDALSVNITGQHGQQNQNEFGESSNTLVVNEDIAVKSVPEQQDVFCMFETDICSGEQVGVETEKTKQNKSHKHEENYRSLLHEFIKHLVPLVCWKELKVIIRRKWTQLFFQLVLRQVRWEPPNHHL